MIFQSLIFIHGDCYDYDLKDSGKNLLVDHRVAGVSVLTPLVGSHRRRRGVLVDRWADGVAGGCFQRRTIATYDFRLG